MEEREQKSSGLGCVLVGAMLILLVSLYILAIGPASWVAERYPSTEYFLECVYLPVIFTADCWNPMGQVLEWYLNFWHPPAPSYPPGVTL